MKTILILAALVAAVCARPETYNSRYDDFDAQELVDNVRLLTAYGNCFLDVGPCTPEGADFKKTIPEAVKTDCAKCTPKQRNLIRVVVKGFQEKTPAIWNKLLEKEDPTGEYRDKVVKFANSSD